MYSALSFFSFLCVLLFYVLPIFISRYAVVLPPFRFTFPFSFISLFVVRGCKVQYNDVLGHGSPTRGPPGCILGPAARFINDVTYIHVYTGVPGGM